MNAETMFYEVMWRAWTRRAKYPLPWWVQQSLRHWSDDYDTGLFESREAAFAANALYRYWNMIGVKDAGRESLVGQAGEIEPVYEAYTITAFIVDPASGDVHLPQLFAPGPSDSTVRQHMCEGYLPVVETTYTTGNGIVLGQRALATTVGDRQRSLVLNRISVTAPSRPQRGWLGVAILPFGPSSFQRHDRAGRYVPDRQISFLRYLANENRVEVNAGWGPIFDSEPATVGMYGNPTSVFDPDLYLQENPFSGLSHSQAA